MLGGLGYFYGRPSIGLPDPARPGEWKTVPGELASPAAPPTPWNAYHARSKSDAELRGVRPVLP